MKPKKSNLNWRLIGVLFLLSVFWIVATYLYYEIIILKAKVSLHQSNKAYEQVMLLKEKSLTITAYRERSYSNYQIKILNEIKEISKEQGFEWKLAVAIAKLETQWGIKVVGRNNLYNIKRTGDTYRNYSTTRESILDFINLLNTSRHYKEFQKSRKLKDLYNYAEDPLWEWKVQNIMNTL